MPVASNFDESPDAGFARTYDARAAKRQLQISIALVFVLAFAAAVIGVLAQLERPQTRTLVPRLGSAEAAQF